MANEQQQGTNQPSPEDRYRSAVQDAAVVIRKLAPKCKSLDDLVGMLELAASNDGQLALLMDYLGALQFRP